MAREISSLESLRKLSIIIPTFNPTDFDLIQANITSYSSLENVEIIIVDSSQDRFYERLLNEHDHLQYFWCETNSRAARLNMGADKARGEWLLLHHPRSSLKVDDPYQIYV